MSSKRKLFIPILGISMSFLIIVYVTRSDKIRTREQLVLLDTKLSCHYLTDEDALPAAEKFDVPLDSVFFLETSCRGGLTSRQACAVESVARIHPEKNIYVFFSSPVTEEVLTNSCLAELLNFDNVRVGRIHMAVYAKDTALYELLVKRADNEAPFKIEHTADMLRLITLYKYGGLYLDTDVLVVKPLDALGKNWAARQDPNFVNNAVMASSKDGVGHDIIGAVLDEIKSNYQPDEWSYNGPGAITRVLLKYCNTTKISDLSADICNGFQIHNSEFIYPISWQQNDIYFKHGDLPKNVVENAYTFHIWNRLTHSKKVEKDCPYDKLTRKYCPTTRKMYGEKF